MIKLRHEDESIPILLKNYGHRWADAQVVWDAASGLIKEHEVVGKGIHPHLLYASLGFYAKQLRAYRAVVLLLERGLVIESHPLVRSMLENYFALLHVFGSKDRDELARLYLLWMFAKDNQLARILDLDKDIAARFPDGAQRVEDMRKMEEEERDKMGTRDWELFVRYGPSKSPMVQLATSLGKKAYYDTAYRELSGAVHGSNLMKFVVPQGEGGVEVRIAPTDEGLDTAIRTAMALTADSVSVIDALLDLGHAQEIQKLADLSSLRRET